MRVGARLPALELRHVNSRFSISPLESLSMKRTLQKRAGSKANDAPIGPALSFMQLLWAVAHGLESTSKHMLVTLGVTGPQRLVLRLVGHHRTMSAGDLARTMHIHPSSLTGMLRRLEAAGLLRRTPDPGDKRRAVLTLTASGRRLNAQKRGTVEAVVARTLDAASAADVRASQRLLRSLAAAFEVDTVD